jgi:hypothetical protein
MSWLDTREPTPPHELRERIDAAIAAVRTDVDGDASNDDDISPGVLGDAAIHALRNAVARCDERAAAIDLLTADALLTYMMEAAGEQGSEAIEAVAEAYGNARLAQLVANSEIP